MTSAHTKAFRLCLGPCPQPQTVEGGNRLEFLHHGEMQAQEQFGNNCFLYFIAECPKPYPGLFLLLFGNLLVSLSLLRLTLE